MYNFLMKRLAKSKISSKAKKKINQRPIDLTPDGWELDSLSDQDDNDLLAYGGRYKIVGGVF